jgi:apolipoprotein N-acyltransferase
VERRWVAVLAGLAAGALICASLPPWGWWPLAPVGVALWLLLLRAPSRLDRFAVSWAVGVAWFGPSTLWMWGLTIPGYVLGVLLAWGPMVGVVGLVTPPDRRRLVVLPAAIVAFEWFHSHAPFGGAPLSMLAMSQARGPLLPVAAVGGMLLVGLAITGLGAALHTAIVDRRWKVPVGVTAAVVVTIVVGILPWTGPVEGGSGDEPPSVAVAAVQGGGPQGTRFTSSQAPEVFDRHLRLTRTIESPVDLVVWPENTLNINGDFADHPWRAELAAEASRVGAPIMVGVVQDAAQDPDRFLNYVVTVQPDGSLGGRYDKERRVPFGEYVPLRGLFEPLAGDTLPPRDQIPGEGTARIETDRGSVAVAISWEVFFARRVREGVREGGEWVLNPTNGSSYWLTQVQSQQIATSTLRAVENGRWLVQIAPTGFSAVIDDSGSVLDRTGVSEARVLFADVPRRTGTTPARLLGDLPALLVSLVLVAGAVVVDRRRRIVDVLTNADWDRLHDGPEDVAEEHLAGPTPDRTP